MAHSSAKDNPIVYGIWSPSQETWMVDGDGNIVHTTFLEVAMAQLVAARSNHYLWGPWVAVKIGVDGWPDKEALQTLLEQTPGALRHDDD